MLKFGFQAQGFSSLDSVQVLENGLAGLKRLDHVKMMRSFDFDLFHLFRVAFYAVQDVQSAFVVHFSKGRRPSDQEKDWTFQVFDYFRLELNELHKVVLIGQLK